LAGDITPGTTILDGIRLNAPPKSRVVYQPYGRFPEERSVDGTLAIADVGIVVIGEMPYAEGVGDNTLPSILPSEIGLVERMRERSKVLILVIVSGRPILLDKTVSLSDAIVAAWLPGTEGAGVADNLFGKAPFTGVLPYSWPRSADQLPLGIDLLAGSIPSEICSEPLFPRGYGLKFNDPSPDILLDPLAGCKVGMVK
jgi:beta-glucosidase